MKRTVGSDSYICSYICVLVGWFVSQSLTKRKSVEPWNLVNTFPMNISQQLFFEK